jgi:AcrR family transcriptional regulator
MFEKYNKVQKAVLETTLRLINEKDLQATSMALISKESGVSTGSIYHYFQSKEDIINELYKGIVNFHGEVVLKDFYTNESIQERFQRVWENVIRFTMQYPQGFQFIEQYSFSPYIDDAAKQEAYKGSWCGPLAQLYAEAIKQQIFIDLEPKLMVQMNFGSVVYLIKAYLQNNVDLTDEMIQKVIRSCWNAVSKERDH